MNDLTFIIRHILLMLIHWGLVLSTRLPLWLILIQYLYMSFKEKENMSF